MGLEHMSGQTIRRSEQQCDTADLAPSPKVKVFRNFFPEG